MSNTSYHFINSLHNYNELLNDFVCYHFQQNNNLIVIYSVIISLCIIIKLLHKNLESNYIETTVDIHFLFSLQTTKTT